MAVLRITRGPSIGTSPGDGKGDLASNARDHRRAEDLGDFDCVLNPRKRPPGQHEPRDARQFGSRWRLGRTARRRSRTDFWSMVENQAATRRLAPPGGLQCGGLYLDCSNKLTGTVASKASRFLDFGLSLFSASRLGRSAA